MLNPATLHIETRPDTDGIWLCLDDGHTSTPLARFTDEQAVSRYIQAQQLAFQKAHTMGLMGI